MTIDVCFVSPGARIDHGHHASYAKYAITDGLEFERAVQKAVDLTNVRDTLLIVTADHAHVFNVGGYTDIETPLFGKWRIRQVANKFPR